MNRIISEALASEMIQLLETLKTDQVSMEWRTKRRDALRSLPPADRAEDGGGVETPLMQKLVDVYNSHIQGCECRRCRPSPDGVALSALAEFLRQIVTIQPEGKDLWIQTVQIRAAQYLDQFAAQIAKAKEVGRG